MERVIPDRTFREALLSDLRRLILSSAPAVPDDLSDDAPLISSGLLESVVLLDVMVWVDDRVGESLDLGAVDLAAEWDSMSAIVEFVERRRAPMPTRPPVS